MNLFRKFLTPLKESLCFCLDLVWMWIVWDKFRKVSVCTWANYWPWLFLKNCYTDFQNFNSLFHSKKAKVFTYKMLKFYLKFCLKVVKKWQLFLCICHFMTILWAESRNYLVYFICFTIHSSCFPLEIFTLWSFTIFK